MSDNAAIMNDMFVANGSGSNGSVQTNTFHTQIGDPFSLSGAPLNVGSSGGGGSSTAVNGNSIASFKIIQPPDDRYIPGYSETQVDGDTKTVGPRLKDLNIPFSLYGLSIPITFGVRRLYANLIWCIPLRENIKKKKKGGKGGKKKKSTFYEYFGTFAVAFGYPGNTDHGARDIIRIWADGSLIYDRRGFGQTKIANLVFRFYPGSETQMPDPIIEEKQGVGNVPAYRGMMYLVIVDMPLAAFGDRPPAISIEVGDATSPVYTITNILADFDNIGSRFQVSFVQDLDSLLGMTFVSRTGYSKLRTYDLQAGNIAFSGPINTNGIGWLTNSGNVDVPDYPYQFNMQSNSWPMGYIPWLGQLVAMSEDFAGAVMLIDPFTGLASDWCGSRGFAFGGGGGVRAEYPQHDLVLPKNQGYIPSIKKWTANICYNVYAIDTYICGLGVNGDAVFIRKAGDTGYMDIAQIYTSASYYTCTPGPADETGSVFFAVAPVSSHPRKVEKIHINIGAVRNGAGPGLGFTRTTYLTFSKDIQNIYWFPIDDTLIIFFADGEIKKYNNVPTQLATVTISASKLPSPDMSNTMWLNDTTGGTMGWRSPVGVTEYDLTFGTTQDFTEAAGAITDPVFDSRIKAIAGVSYGGGGSAGTGQTATMDGAVSVLYYDRLDDVRMPLSDFILGMALYAGYLEAEIEIDPSIDDEIDGALITNGTTYRKIIASISTVYRIDVIETGGKVKFVRKTVGYTGTDFTIPDRETLGPQSDSLYEPTFNLQRNEEISLPQRVQLRYIDKSLSYNWSMQMATRSQFINTNDSNNEITFELPIVMTAVEARTLATRALWLAWNSRVSYEFRLAPKWNFIEPGDVGLITVDNIQYNIKTVEVTYNNDFSLTVRASSFLSDEAVLVVAEAGTGYPQTIPVTYGSKAWFLDIPLLRSNEDLNYASNFPIYTHIGSKIPNPSVWLGGSLFTSDNSLEFNEVSTNVDGAVVCTVIVPPVLDSWYETDFEATMVVSIRSGSSDELISCTLDEMNTGSNLCAYGKPGRWELVQFQTVTDNMDGTYTLSVLRRGRNGTAANHSIFTPQGAAFDAVQVEHPEGDDLVLLTPSSTDAIVYTFDRISQTIRYKATGFGQDETEVVLYESAVLAGYAALPYPPHGITMSRVIADDTGDITINWLRRGRVPFSSMDSTPDLLSTDRESNDYKITIRSHLQYSGWFFFSGSWNAAVVSHPEHEILVTDATTYSLLASEIRSLQLYEYSGPNIGDISNPMAVFAQQPGGQVEEILENVLLADLYTSPFMAFPYLDIMIQQKTTVPTIDGSGYGPGLWTRVYIKDL